MEEKKRRRQEELEQKIAERQRLREKTAAHFDAGSAGASAAAGEQAPLAKRRKQQR